MSDQPGTSPVPPRTPALLRRLADDFGALRRQWGLAGGLAVNAWTGAGDLDDIDVVVAASGDDQAETLVRVLHERGYSAVTQVEDEDMGRLASVSLQVLGAKEEAPVQLIFASSGIEPEIAGAAVEREVFGVRLPVAVPGHLIAMKLLSHGPGRPQDAEDIRALLGAADGDEFQRAEDAFTLIADRGFTRGRDLRAEYQRFISRASEEVST